MATPIPPNNAGFSFADVAAITGGQLSGETSGFVSSVAIDSRAVRPGALFVAIRGAEQDGAKYLPAAVAAGATLLLVHAGTPCPADVTRVEVADTTAALARLASAFRVRWGKRLIAITGSAGKTTTKELTAAALARADRQVLRTCGNLNNQFGVPMMLLCLSEQHELAVLELGTSGKGEIASLARICAPNVGVVLLASAAHTEGLGTVLAVADEKASLWSQLAKDGTAIVNLDDENLPQRVPAGLATLSFGHGEGADVRLLAARVHAGGTDVTASVQGREISFALPIIGEAAALDACAALAAVLAVDGSAGIDAALTGLASTLAPAGRMALVKGQDDTWLLDDSYNANPSSTSASLHALAELAKAREVRSVAVLGDMKELGELSAREHARIGELAVRLGIDVLVGCGPEMMHATAQAARVAAGRLAPHPTRVVHVMDPAAALPTIKSLLRPHDVVLIKGSRSLGMERFVDALRALEEGRP